eukprot:3771684-Alexandrium_andersonii.AAC.1
MPSRAAHIRSGPSVAPATSQMVVTTHGTHMLTPCLTQHTHSPWELVVCPGPGRHNLAEPTPGSPPR